MTKKYIVILCTCPDADSATTIANTLIDQGLAACANIISGVHSIYRWQGQRESSEECLLLIKSAAALFPQLEQTIVAQHPYELPEIIAVSVEKGLAAYLSWIDDSLASK